MAGALLALASCSQPASRVVVEPLEDTVAALVEAIGAKSIARVLEHVSYDFRSTDGLDFVDVQAIVENFMLPDGVLGARIENLSIEDTGTDGEKRASVWVTFARGARLAEGSPAPPGAPTYAFDLVFVQNDGRWQAVRGRYSRE